MLKKKFFSYEFLKNIENNFLKDAEVFLLKNLNVLFKLQIPFSKPLINLSIILW